MDRNSLETLYEKLNRRRFVHPDPLEFLYRYPDIRDREIAGLLASSLAYGNVRQILKSVSTVLARMTPSLYAFTISASPERAKKTFRGFKHRWHTGDDLCQAVLGIQRVIKKYGSLHACFLDGLGKGNKNVGQALSRFVVELAIGAPLIRKNFFPLPARGSACKRLNLFLRWMVRKDDVDPGGWDKISPSILLVPLDTHMHRVALALKLTKRKQADLKTTIEITEGFKKIAPEDPVRYDFALTRFGINKKATSLAIKTLPTSLISRFQEIPQ